MAGKACRSAVLLLLSRSSSGGGGVGAVAVAAAASSSSSSLPGALSAPHPQQQTLRRAHGLRSASHSKLFSQPPTALSLQKNNLGVQKVEKAERKHRFVFALITS
ncbi:hypothetical protein CRUP_026387 [Coryphaenoides rupestris]|nr:hypothetical protein CRUP_026387 [Coryphaenoides rupestris]